MRQGIRGFILTVVVFSAGLLVQSPAAASDSVEQAGNVLQILIPAAGLGGTVFYEKGNEGKIQFLESFVTTELATVALKKAVRKRRPNGNCCDAFPSGHTSAAFMGAGFILKRYGWRYSALAFAAATFVGYSRVESDKHHVEDVIAGAAIGSVSSFYFTHRYKGFVIVPTADNGVYGIRISKRW